MRKLDLTPKERALYNRLLQLPGAILRQHKNPKGKKCFRLLDAAFNPLGNYPENLIVQLYEKNLIEKNKDNCFVLKPEVDETEMYKNIGLVKDTENDFTPIPKRNI